MNVLRARLVAVGALTAGLLVQPRSLPLQGAEPACEFDRIERVVAVGDVHGAYDAFVGILRTAGLIDERQRWVGSKAHLVQTGDVVDRGPDSRKALDLLEKLQGDARKAGGAVHPLIGNHEAMRLLGDMRYVSPGGTGRSSQDAPNRSGTTSFNRRTGPSARISSNSTRSGCSKCASPSGATAITAN